MSDYDIRKGNFEKRLTFKAEEHNNQTNQELEKFRQGMLYSPLTKISNNFYDHSIDFDTQIRKNTTDTTTAFLSTKKSKDLSIPLGGHLSKLDDFFIDLFQFDKFLPPNQFNYPTYYCETPEDFFHPFLETYQLSELNKKEEMDKLIRQAKTDAKKGRAVLGVNLPGQGCFINGWIFGFMSNSSAQEAFQIESVKKRIFETTVHEKMGHGFICTFSPLGQLSVVLGQNLHEYASKFGLDSKLEIKPSLNHKMAQLIFRMSLLVEEGWSTWVESWFSKNFLNNGEHPRYSLREVVIAIQNLPYTLPDRNSIITNLLSALQILFLDKSSEPEDYHQATLIIDTIGSEVDGILPLKQPIRYAVGELLVAKIERNLGTLCVPYAILIADNIQIDPNQISLSDLAILMHNDPRLNPDARLASISSICSHEKNDLAVLSNLVFNKLSLTIPESFPR